MHRYWNPAAIRMLQDDVVSALPGIFEAEPIEGSNNLSRTPHRKSGHTATW